MLEGSACREKELAEIVKLNEETRKLVAEARRHTDKNQFFIVLLALAVFAAGIVFAKLFL